MNVPPALPDAILAATGPPDATVVHTNPDVVLESAARYNPFVPAVSLVTVLSALPTIKSPLASNVVKGIASTTAHSSPVAVPELAFKTYPSIPAVSLPGVSAAVATRISPLASKRVLEMM